MRAFMCWPLVLAGVFLGSVGVVQPQIRPFVFEPFDAHSHVAAVVVSHSPTVAVVGLPGELDRLPSGVVQTYFRTGGSWEPAGNFSDARAFDVWGDEVVLCNGRKARFYFRNGGVWNFGFLLEARAEIT